MTDRVRSWARDTEMLAPVPEEADPGFFEHRAMLAFRALAAIYLAGIVLAFFPEPNRVSLLLILTFNLAALILAIVYLLIARGLRQLHRWAVAVARPVLVLIVVEDIVLLITTVLDGRIRVPVATVIAGWALLGPIGVQPIPRPKVFGAVVLALATPMLATLVFSHQVFGWGGVLDVQQSDLVSSVVASCGPAGGNPGTPAGEPPDTIHLTYEWAWKKGSPVPSGLDIVVIGWTGDDAEGRPLYLLGRFLPTAAGIYDGRRAYPSIEMGNAVAAASKGSWQWGIELDEQLLRPGRIEVDLQRARDVAPGSQPLRFLISYVHLGLWHVDVPLTCEW
jgi:hypothetical protein